MKISVITVCFNAESTIEACLESVARQTYPQVEHVIIDGASTDDTFKLVRRASHSVKAHSEPDQGIYDAMNKGVAKATGDLLLFLNSDDKFATDHALDDAVREIVAHPDADVYYGSLEVRRRDGSTIVYRPDGPEKAAEIMVCGCLPHQSTLARPWVFGLTSGFDTRYPVHADYDWFLKVIADPRIRLGRLECVIGSFFDGGASSGLEAAQPEVYHIQNSSSVYTSQDWDRRRIGIYQQAFLAERVEVGRLRSELAKTEAAFRALRARSVRRFFRRFPKTLLRQLKRVFRGG